MQKDQALLLNATLEFTLFRVAQETLTVRLADDGEHADMLRALREQCAYMHLKYIFN